MARKKASKQDEIECNVLRTGRIELMDEQRGVSAVIGISPVSNQPYLSFWDVNELHGISLNIGKNGNASIAIGGKEVLIVGLNAFSDGRRTIFVLDDNGCDIFAAGVDMNGVRYIRLLAKDGSTVWEVTDENKVKP